jgi:hypothetical protein
MSVQWDDPERVGHFIRLLEVECKAWQDTAESIQSLLSSIAPAKAEEAFSSIRQCRARAEALRRLVRHICEGDFTLLEHPETPTS